MHTAMAVPRYVPNSGWDERGFRRRELWDERLIRAVRSWRAAPKPLLWAGDLNVCATDTDASHAHFFRHGIYNKQGNKHVIPADAAYKGPCVRS